MTDKQLRATNAALLVALNQIHSIATHTIRPDGFTMERIEELALAALTMAKGTV